MNSKPGLEISALAAALALGILGDGLLRCFPWGLNFALWGCVFAATLFFLHRSAQRLSTGGGGWLLTTLAVVFVWFLLTVLRGARERFAFGTMVAGFALVATLYALNPDALIARTNLARASARRNFDPSYLTGLSAYAIPAIIAGLPALRSGDRCSLAQQLLARWPPGERTDWRSWTLSGARARSAVKQDDSNLRAACGRAEK